MKQKADVRFLILRTLRDYPFLSESQLRWLWSWTKAVTQRYLWDVQGKGWVRRYPFFVETKHTTVWLYTVTAKGLQVLLQREPLSLSEYQQKYNFSISRLRWLALVLERVYHSREVLYHLHTTNGKWDVRRWNSETEVRYPIANGARRLFFHCTANFCNDNTHRWLRLGIEWDTGDLPIEAERKRWQDFVRAQGECPSAYYDDSHFPILFYVARDWQRMNQFKELIHEIKRNIRESMPYIWLTYRAKLAQGEQNPASNLAVWTDVVEEHWISQPLTCHKGVPEEPARFWRPRPWRMSFHGKQVELEPLDVTAALRPKISDMAMVALALHPLEKKLVRTIGSHPMLTASELAMVLESAKSKVWQGLDRLTRWQIIKPKACQAFTMRARRWDTIKAYTLSDLGVIYLATAAGLGVTPKRLSLAHGWEKGFGAQVHHSEHTRIGNELFIQILKYARAHEFEMTWYSEQEARLYLNYRNAQWSGPFQSVRISPASGHEPSEREEENAGEYEGTSITVGGYGNRREFFRELARYGTHFDRFLPDGRAVLEIGDASWHVAVEIDLTRANTTKMIAKLNYYYMFLNCSLDQPTLCILLVTHSWRRAKNLYWLAWKRASQATDQEYRVDLALARLPWAEALDVAERHIPAHLQQRVLPIYITTKDELRQHGMHAAIWLRVREPLGKDGRVNHIFTKARWLEYLEEQSAK